MNSDALSAYWKAQLEERAADGLLRTPEPPGTGLVDFASNDYLGLVYQGGLRRLYHQALSEPDLPLGATGSRLLTGQTPQLAQTEALLAETHQAEAALVFSSTYQANLAFFSALLPRTGTYIYDELSHASIRDGLRLSPARAYKFPHLDWGALAQRLTQTSSPKVVVTESVFSMDGDSPDLEALAQLCIEHQAWLVVDEAHALGVAGPAGLGLAQALAERPELNLVRVLGFGKAFALGGGAILGSALLKTWLVNTARPLIYTTAANPLLLRVLELLYRDSQAWAGQRQELLRLTTLYDEQMGVSQSDLPLQGAIRTWSVPGNREVMQAEAQLKAQGLDVRGIRSPTVAAGTERLRIVLHAHNTPEQVRTLTSLLKKL